MQLEVEFELKFAELKFLPNVVRNSQKYPILNPKWGPKHHITSHLGGEFPQVSHSWAIGSEAKPKLAQILCGSPDLGDLVPDAAVPPRATPPYPLDTFGGLRTNFSSINPSDRASVIIIINLRRSATEARLGLVFEGLSEMDFGFRRRFQFQF